MEDKQYLDEAGLGEVGKVIKENYASKEDLSKIDVTEQLVDYVKKTEVPTKLSQFTNDKSFKTEDEIRKLINDSKKLKKEVVTSLPSSGVEDVVYLLKNKSDSNNVCTEYLWINENWEIIGDTKADLTGYAKKSDLENKVDKVDGKSLSSNDYTNEDKQMLGDLQTNQDWDSLVEFCREQANPLNNGSLGSYIVSDTNMYWSYNFVEEKDIGGERCLLFDEQKVSEENSAPYIINMLRDGQLDISGATFVRIQKILENGKLTFNNSEPCHIAQEFFNISRGMLMFRTTKEAKIEYNDQHLLEQWKIHGENLKIQEIVTHDDWESWTVIPSNGRKSLIAPVQPTQKVAGLMLPEDKRKLDSIDVEAIKSLIQRVEALESKMH